MARTPEPKKPRQQDVGCIAGTLIIVALGLFAVWELYSDLRPGLG